LRPFILGAFFHKIFFIVLKAEIVMVGK